MAAPLVGLVLTATLAASPLEVCYRDAITWEGRARSCQVALRSTERLLEAALTDPSPVDPLPAGAPPGVDDGLSVWHAGLMVAVGITGAAVGALITAAAFAL